MRLRCSASLKNALATTAHAQACACAPPQQDSRTAIRAHRQACYAEDSMRRSSDPFGRTDRLHQHARSCTCGARKTTQALLVASYFNSTVLQIIVPLCHYWKTFRPRGRAVLNRTLEVRFEQDGEVVAAALSHADRKQPAHWYLKGLLLPGGRKSVEPMAARVHPQNVGSAHQSMHHLVADADWSDQALLAAVAAQVLPTLSRKSAACHWIVDDTGFSKKGLS
ncbi:transposase ISXo8 [Xanthomonas oryzae pv. oryzae PXO86]|nr:transposase ISXo8 [Xanthomonas oryzae pv. oryzae PXO86]